MAGVLGRIFLGFGHNDPGERSVAEKVGYVGGVLMVAGVVIVTLGTLAWLGAVVFNQLVAQVDEPSRYAPWATLIIAAIFLFVIVVGASLCALTAVGAGWRPGGRR